MLVGNSENPSTHQNVRRSAMHVAPCDVTIHQVNPEVAEIEIRGELSGFSHKTVLDAFSQACKPGVQAIGLNFTRTEYLNSAGIGLLVNLLIQARQAGQRLYAYGLNQHYKKIFQMTHLSESIPVFSDNREALAALGV
jgi:anti-anti-sigma factor